MTVPIAFAGMASQLAQVLSRESFISGVDILSIDEDLSELIGDEVVYSTSAALTRGQTRTVRTILGRPLPRYVVEHRATLDLAWAGPDRAAGAARLSQALAAIGLLAAEDPTLDGVVERFFIEEGADEPLPPNGWSTSLVCAFRIRSGDPLGLTP